MRLLRVALALTVVVVVCTGLGLMLLYGPPVAQSVAGAKHEGVTAGGFVRGIHFWVSQMIGPVILLHLLLLSRRRGSADRRLKITAIAVLYLLAVLFWFTGVLLPWDQLAFWLARARRSGGIGLSLQQVYWAHIVLLPILSSMALFPYVRHFRKGERSIPSGATE